MDLFFKALAALFGFISVSAALYNLLTAHRRAKQVQYETKQADKIDAALLTAHRNDQRLTALEGKVNSMESRIERQIERMADSLEKVKEMFTKYLIN